jgi:hypothetical protein
MLLSTWMPLGYRLMTWHFGHPLFGGGGVGDSQAFAGGQGSGS